MPIRSASSPAGCTTRAWAPFASSACTSHGCCDARDDDGGCRRRRTRAALVRTRLQSRGRLSRGLAGGVGHAATDASAGGHAAGRRRLAATAGRMLARDGARPTHVVVAAEADPAVERFLRGGVAPVRFVTRAAPTASLALLAALRRGEIVALQGDRALGTRGDVLQPFFGAPAPFPLGPFVLARAAGAPVVPAFCLLDADRRYRIVVGAPSSVEAGGEEAALRRWVATLQAMVKRHPAQWFNFYDVWSPPA